MASPYDHRVSSYRKRRDSLPAPLVLTTETANALRRAQLDLLAELDRVCGVNGLEYFALYGTALGAVRHQGFIPWDDDLDVGMLRPDFDRLTQIIDGELSERFFFQTVRTDPHYGCMFGKLRMTGTRCVDRVSYGSAEHGGIFIDVFPLDAKAVKRRTLFEQRLLRHLGFRLLYLKAGYLFRRGKSVPARAVQLVARAVGRFLPRRLVIAMSERQTRLGGPGAPNQYVSLFGGYAYDREIVDAAWIHPLVRQPFEDATIPVMRDVDAYLTRLYGDYQQPPPPELQVGPHELVELDLSGADL